MASYRRVSIDAVPVGAILRAPITDPENPPIKLLSEGIAVSQPFIDKLRSRGIGEVIVGTRDLARIEAFKPQGRTKTVPPAPKYVLSKRTNDITRELDGLIRERKSLTLGRNTEPLSLSIHRPKDCGYRGGLEEEWAGENDRQVVSLGEMFDASCSGADLSTGLLRTQCEEILGRLEQDCDALVCLAGSPYSTEYPSRHAVHLASMAMAIGVEVGLDHSNLLELGIGCLIHDVGMQQVGLEWFNQKSAISPAGLANLADHPVHAIEAASRLDEEIPHASLMVAYQMHERLDGTGYPRGVSGDQIHVLAKIASVADQFVALLAPRSHRLGIQGYFAVRHILNEMKQGKFDPRAVRALLLTTGLFPVGSYVILTNDQIGRVIRSGGVEFDNPTVEMWESHDLTSKPVVVNLQSEDSIQIVGSIPMPRAA